jgi:hypothetical protein
MSITATTAKQAVLDIINAENSTTLSLTDVTLSGMKAVKAGENPTTIDVAAIADGKYTGAVTVQYNRQPAGIAFASLPVVELPQSAVETEETLFDWLKANWINQLPVPFDEGLVMTLGDEGNDQVIVTFDLTDHLVLRDKYVATLAVAKPSLEDALKVTELTAFTEDDVKAK